MSSLVGNTRRHILSCRGSIELPDWWWGGKFLSLIYCASVRTCLRSLRKGLRKNIPKAHVGTNFSRCFFKEDWLYKISKIIWCLSPMRAAEVQASLRIRAVLPEPPLLAHTSSESRGTFRQKARSLAPLNGWACAVKVCHDRMLEDTNSLDGTHFVFIYWKLIQIYELNNRLCYHHRAAIIK